MTNDMERRAVAERLRAKHRERTDPGALAAVMEDEAMRELSLIRDLRLCLPPDGNSLLVVLADLIEPDEQHITRRACTMRVIGLDDEMLNYGLQCSACGHVLRSSIRAPRYCPNCGAKVVEE